MDVRVNVELTVAADEKHLHEMRSAAAALTNDRASVRVWVDEDDPQAMFARFTMPKARQMDVVEGIRRGFSLFMEDYNTQSVSFLKPDKKVEEDHSMRMSGAGEDKRPGVELDVFIRYEIERNFMEGEEDNIFPVLGSIYGRTEEGGNEIHLGDQHFILLKIGNALNEGASLYDVFDSTHETMEAGEAIFDATFREFIPWIQKRFPTASLADDLLLLNRLTLRPEARGQRLGLAILRHVIRDWSSGCSLVVMKPYPLQFEGGEGKPNPEKVAELDLDSFTVHQPEALRRLRAYYSQLGFERIGRSDFYALSMHENRPPVENLPDSIIVPSELVDGTAE